MVETKHCIEPGGMRAGLERSKHAELSKIKRAGKQAGLRGIHLNGDSMQELESQANKQTEEYAGVVCK